MTRTRPGARALPLAAALVLGLTACGPGGGTTSGAAPEELGPLDTYMEQIYGLDAAGRPTARTVEVEEAVAGCMREQGFEYTPVDHSARMRGTFGPEDLDVEPGSREFAEQYGYGMTTDPYGRATPEPMLFERDGWTDPNHTYVEALPEGEQLTYYQALHGAMATGPADHTRHDWGLEWTQAGCRGRAQHEVYETVPGIDPDEVAALRAEMGTLGEAFSSDPRMQEVESAWAACMADAGYTGLTAVGDAQRELNTALNVHLSEAYDDFYAEQPMGAELTEAELHALEERTWERLSELTPREIETAVADADCREQVGYAEVERAVTFEHQQAFVDAHRAQLDAWAAGARS